MLRPRRFPALLVLALLPFVAFCTRSASAQTPDPDYVLSLGAITGGPGSRVAVPLRLEITAGAAPVQGYSFAVAHDPAHAFAGAVEGPDLLALNAGNGPDYVTMYAAPGGWIGAAVVSFAQVTTIPAGGTHLLHIASYDLGASLGTTALGFTTLGTPPIETMVVADTQEIDPVLVAGSLTVAPYSLTIESGSAVVGSETAVDVRLTSPAEIDAFELGIAHDPADLAVVEVAEGILLAAVAGGPEAFVLEILPDGYTLAVVIDSSGFGGESLAAAAGEALVTATYAVAVLAVEPVEIGFSNLVGSGVDTALHLESGTIIPELTGGTLTLVVPPLLRGDCDGSAVVNIADPVSALDYLFNGGIGHCLDGCDVNASGVLNIADPIYTLEYLFLSGPPPAPPFPACAPSPPALGCTTTQCP